MVNELKERENILVVGNSLCKVFEVEKSIESLWKVRVVVG